MQVPLHLVGGRNRQVRIPGGAQGGGAEVLQYAPGWLELGSRDLEMAGAGCGAGLGKRQPGTGMSDPGSARTRGATRPKNIGFPNY